MSSPYPTLAQGLRLHQQGKFQQAGQVYRQVLQLDPRNADAMHLLGVVAFQQAGFEPSAWMIEQAIALKPGQYNFHHNLGSTYRVLGRFDDARRQYRAAIELKNDYAEAYFNLSAIHRFDADDPLIGDVEELLRAGGLSELDTCFLHFAAGKAYDDSGQYDQAFAHFEQGNRAADARFDPEPLRTFAGEVKSIVDHGFLDARAGQGHADDTPVFVVGMPRSGTSLVEQILASHPDVHGAGELPDITGITKALDRHTADRASYPGALATIGPHVWQGFGRSYLLRLRRMDATARRIVDKNPINHQHLGLILTMLPAARVVHCVRDPLDTGLSCYFQRFRSGQEFSYSFEGIAAFYHVYRDLMDHWRSLAGERILDVEYEEVVRDIEGQARRLVDFCGLAWDDRCLDFHRAARPVATASDIQVRQPLYAHRVERWRNYREHVGPLRDLLDTP